MSIVKTRELARTDGSAKIESLNLVRREGHSQPDEQGQQASELLRQVSTESTREINRLIDDLKNLREKLDSDFDRVEREIVGYASLNQSVVDLTKIISDSMTQVKLQPYAPSRGTRVPDAALSDQEIQHEE